MKNSVLKTRTTKIARIFGLFTGVFLLPGGIYILTIATTVILVLTGITSLLLGVFGLLQPFFYTLTITRTHIEKKLFATYSLRLAEIRKIDLYNKSMDVYTNRSHMLIPRDLERVEEVIRVILDRVRMNPALIVNGDKKVKQKYGVDSS